MLFRFGDTIIGSKFKYFNFKFFVLIWRILRFLPQFKGKQRLSRLLIKVLRVNKNDVQVKAKVGLIYVLPNLSENVGFEIFINGVYEDKTISFILGRLPMNGTLLDIGANIGAISIPIAKKRADIAVVAVEASPRVFTYLARNIQLNQLNNYTASQVALSDQDGQLVNFFSPEEKYGKGSLAPVFTNAGSLVKSITFDQLFESIGRPTQCFIKMDIEGFEYKALLGGRALFSKADAPDILFEFVDWAEKAAGNRCGDAQKLLIDFGYNLYLLDEHTNQLRFLSTPVEQGFSMIYATKKHV